MSGRLVISSKKSYCPWKPENVERVLRDEEAHRRQAQQQAAAAAAAAAATRTEPSWKQLKLNKTTTTAAKSSSDDNVRPWASWHVNLFEAEEKQAVQDLLEGNPPNATQQRKKPGIMPVFLDPSHRGGKRNETSSMDEVYSKRGRRRRYDVNRGDDDDAADNASWANKKQKRRDEEQKARADPMHSFHQRHWSEINKKVNNNNSNRDVESKRTEKKKKRRSDSTTSTPNRTGKHGETKRPGRRRDRPRDKRNHRRDNDDDDIMKQLREKRLQRERTEQDRQQRLLGRSAPAAGRAHSSQYNDQFHPGIARR